MIAPILWLPTALLLGYTIPACYLDLKHREMPEGFWTLLWLICIPITAWLYVIGIYPLTMLALSLAAVAVYFGLMLLHVYEGADFMFLMWISLFLVQNPRTGNILMPVSFAVCFLSAFLICAGFYVFFPPVKNYLKAQDLPGFPMMLPISLALWLTVFA